MKKTLCLSVLSMQVLVGLSVFAADLKLESDTPVKVVIKQNISSASASIGQPIDAEIERDVRVNDKVVVREGTPVKVLVAHAAERKRLGKGGELSLTVESTRTVDGQRVHLKSALGKSGYSNTTSTVVLTVLFGLPGLLRRGEEAYIKSGTIISAYIDDDVMVKIPTPDDTKPTEPATHAAEPAAPATPAEDKN